MAKQLPTLTIAGDYEPIETGTYPAVLTDLEVVTNPFEQGREQLQWTFTITAGEYKDRQLRAYSSMATGAKSKLYQWACALLQRPLNPKEPLDLNELLGKPCRITVLVRRKDNGQEYNRVDDVLPAKKTPSGSDPFSE